ncbi:MAG: phosphoribosylaminoimidazolesuccinocarboxamide synthase [Phycisphaerales bacterium]|nr:phosphoribosylaminoimidazolesuccinocarboxamide synthase [Phycisphaerales bacterium]
MGTGTTGVSAPQLPLPLLRRGKVRDVYELPATAQSPEGRLLLVASDRISAFDVVMPTPIDGKGRVLTQMAAFWFGFINRRGICETHYLSGSVADLPAGVQAHARWLEGRITIGRRCRVIPVECVVRGYLEGSGWREYQQTGEVCGVRLPKGLRQCDRLPEPIFTPATKEASGHDQNITFEQACDIAGLETMGVLRDLSLKIYRAAAEHALARGIIIADTKFEFGLRGGAGGSEMRAARVWEPPILIDEALTPDSSRFWPVDGYEPGRAQRSFDKQFLREYLDGLVAAGRWNKEAPGPELPGEIVRGTLSRYREALDRLTR